MLKNYMEEVIANKLKEMLDGLDVCKCPKCIMDIEALALNNLPPKYVASEKGELYSKVNLLMQQFEVDVIAAIIRAAAIVKEHPRHENANP